MAGVAEVEAGLAQREQHVQRGGLARAVRAQERHCLAGPQVQAQPVDRAQAPVVLGHVLERDHRSAGPSVTCEAAVTGGACVTPITSDSTVTSPVLAHPIPLSSGLRMTDFPPSAGRPIPSRDGRRRVVPSLNRRP